MTGDLATSILALHGASPDPQHRPRAQDCVLNLGVKWMEKCPACNDDGKRLCMECGHTFPCQTVRLAREAAVAS
jgi:hypothetical protein